MKQYKGTSLDVDLFFTHTHWDHIQGLPFFTPAYIKGNNVRVYGEAQITGDLVSAVNNTDPTQLSSILQINGVGVKAVLADQQKPRNFPAPLEYMAGLSGFYDFIPGGKIKEEYRLKVESRRISHPGGCVSYKFTDKHSSEDKVIVISTDFEPDSNGLDNNLVDWWQNADLVLADGQYETGSKQNPFMKGWGHSDPFVNIELAKRANVRRIVMTHHDPKSDDAYLRDLELRVKAKALELSPYLQVDFAREGQEFVV